MSLVEYAESELAIAGISGSDGYDGAIYESVMAIVSKFASQGHSGMSGSITLTILERVLNFKPLSHLTGDDTEWNEVETGQLWQNRRCGTIFKNAEGRAWNIDLPRDGDEWQSITFPYWVE